MKKTFIIFAAFLSFTSANSSQLSKYLHQIDKDNQARKEREWAQDMNFDDYVFKLQTRTTNAHGQQCREYAFRSRSNPYRHGHFSVCEERY